MERRPDFYIIGAQRSGTSAIRQYLGKHPEIFVPSDLEPMFFASDLRIPAAIHQLSAYTALFANVGAAKRVGEGSALYLYSRKAALEIKAFTPNARIIIMLRNPVDQIYSVHGNYAAGGVERIRDFQAALDAEEPRKAGKMRNIAPGFPIELLYYREQARYTQQVKRYIEGFGRENIHVIIFDEFIRDTPRMYREVLRFLDVNEGHVSPLDIVNPGWTVKSRFAQSLFLMPPVGWLGRALLSRGVRNAIMRWNAKPNPLPPMDVALRRRLQADFKGEAEILSQLLNRDLSFWTDSQEPDRILTR